MSLLVRTIILLGPHFNDSQYFQDVKNLRYRLLSLDSNSWMIHGVCIAMGEVSLDIVQWTRPFKAVETHYRQAEGGIRRILARFGHRTHCAESRVEMVVVVFQFASIPQRRNYGVDGRQFPVHLHSPRRQFGADGFLAAHVHFGHHRSGCAHLQHQGPVPRDPICPSFRRPDERPLRLCRLRVQQGADKETRAVEKEIGHFLARLLRTYVRGTAPVPNESGDGFAMTLALPCWSPFDADHSTFGFIVTFAFELGYIAAILIPVSAEYTRMASVHQREVRQYTNARCASTPGGGLPRYTRSGKSRVHPLRVSTPRNIQK
ncbi:unnamed protein product [Nesidiocoris tenuis]|uniref:Uncharacterized protein n=1 Tax=Nesidiocoris tenuis TaxID=355587 RepID=A0A6H5HRU8_9HEMI|nr:unnamed protein product [Nesidiocoris tenuis]